LLGLFLRAVGDDDAADLLFAFIEAVNENPIVERAHVHDCFLTVSAGRGVAAASAVGG
jgi:hypothetical protein